MSTEAATVTFRIETAHDSYIEVAIARNIEFRTVIEDYGEGVRSDDGADDGQDWRYASSLALLDVAISGAGLPAPIRLQADEWVDEDGRLWSRAEGDRESQFECDHRRVWNSRLPPGLSADALWARIQAAIIEAGIELPPSKRIAPAAGGAAGGHDVRD